MSSRSCVTDDLSEELCGELARFILESLLEAKMDISIIQEIVLVGGSTRIPEIERMLNNIFSGEEIKKSIDPDEVVAYGAALRAAILQVYFNITTILFFMCSMYNYIFF